MAQLNRVGGGHRPLAVVVAAMLAGGGLLMATPVVWAQEAPPATRSTGPAQTSADPVAEAESADPAQDQASQLDEVSVVGLRETLQSSIATKRDATAIVDAISSSEIGGIPATSISGFGK